MKNTGIVRRLDELGRVVIPMEYRKMHRINIGDPMEIMANDNGEIVLKKIGLESEYISNASAIIESVCPDYTILASDGLRWRVGRGPHKDQYLDKVMDQKAVSCFSTNKPILDKNENGQNIFLSPVIGMDGYGVLMIVSDNPILETDKSTLCMLSSIITKLTERF